MLIINKSTHGNCSREYEYVSQHNAFDFFGDAQKTKKRMDGFKCHRWWADVVKQTSHGEDDLKKRDGTIEEKRLHEMVGTRTAAFRD